MTAKSLEENPASQAKSNTVKVIKLFHPEEFPTEFFAILFSTIFLYKTKIGHVFYFYTCADYIALSLAYLWYVSLVGVVPPD